MQTALSQLQLQLERHQLVIFVGADLPAELTGVPARAELARGLSALHHLEPAQRLSEAAQRLVIGASHSLYLDYLSRRLAEANRDPAPLHRHLARLRPPYIVSTSYDTLIERACRQSGLQLNLVVSESDLPRIEPTRTTLIKLFGDIERPATLVVTTADQRALWQSQGRPAVARFVADLLRDRAALLLGFDLEDEDVAMLWRGLTEREGAPAHGAFAVAPGHPETARGRWAQLGLELIDAQPLELLASLAPAPVAIATPTTEPRSQSRPPDMLPPNRPFAPAATPGASADLHLWLRQAGAAERATHEVIVTFRPAGIPADESPIAGAAPSFALDMDELTALITDREAYGAALDRAFFASKPLRDALIRAQQRALGAGAALRIRVQIDAQESPLHAVRWELLGDPLRGGFLALAPNTFLSRYLSSASPLSAQPVSRSWPPALVAIAAPSDLRAYNLPPIDRGRALASARGALAGYDLQELPHASQQQLAERLHPDLAVLYLIAHGGAPPAGATLYLESAAGATAPVPAARLAQLIAGGVSRPRLVVIAACASAGQSEQSEQSLSAIGPRLAMAGVGAVVAMRDQVRIESVEAGMPTLFQELRRHGTIDRAVAAMRRTLYAKDDEWWQPVLYMRPQNGLLW